MKPFFLFFLSLMGMYFVCTGQNTSRFHHLLDQDLIDNNGFTLKQKRSGGDVVMSINTSRFQRKLKDVVTNDKGLLMLDIWRIEDMAEKDIDVSRFPRDRETVVVRTAKGSKTESVTDEFGNIKSTTDTVVNAWTPLLNSPLFLTDSRQRLSDPTLVIRIPLRSWSWSIGTTPFRYRLETDSSKATISSNLSLSLSYGHTWGKTLFTSRLSRHHANTIALFFGLSSADLKSSKVERPTEWKNKKLFDRTNPAVSYGLSYTRSINNLGVVVSLGLDTAIGQYSTARAINQSLGLD